MVLHADCEVTLGGAHFVYECRLTGSSVWGVIGSSGSGKSTLFNMIAGLIKPSRGTITLNDRTLFDNERRINIPAHRRRIGYVFQDNRLFPHLSVRNNVLFGWHGDSRDIKPNEVCELLEIDRLLDADVSTLSGGEQKRVAIARALLSSPGLLLLDEPFAGLDHRRSTTILELLSQVRGEYDIPLLITSHDSGKLGAICDHFVLIEAGSVKDYGPCYKLRTPAHVHSFTSRG